MISKTAAFWGRLFFCAALLGVASGSVRVSATHWFYGTSENCASSGNSRETRETREKRDEQCDVSTVRRSLDAQFRFVSVGNSDDIEDEIFDLVNRERRKARLPEFVLDSQLSRVARKYSRQMARGGFFGHYDRDGNSVVERVTDENIIGWRKIGENLFFCDGFDDVGGAAVKGWLRSSGHRRNMLDRVYTNTGIGVAEARGGGFYVTQVFLTP